MMAAGNGPSKQALDERSTTPSCGRSMSRKANSGTGRSTTGILKRRVLLTFLTLCLSLSRSTYWAQGQILPTSQARSNASSQEESSGFTLEKNCTSPAIEEFPRFLFNQDERANGGVILHALIAIYLIMALGTICDEYFVPALEIICDTLHLSEDVAGASFMAAGTSSPEFFTNVMGTFVTKSDIGIGTIVGSAVFNIFGVISVCGLFTKQNIPLDWYPITRDSITYAITIVILIVVLIDEKVYWYESLAMLGCYFGYILIMAFNGRIEHWSFQICRKIANRISPSIGSQAGPGSEAQTTTPSVTPASVNGGNSTAGNFRRTLQGRDHSSSESANLNITGSTSFQIHFADEDSKQIRDSGIGVEHPERHNGRLNEANEASAVAGGGNATEEEEEEFPGYPWQRPEESGCLATTWWILFLPINIAFFLTIPDVRRGKAGGKTIFRNLYPLSFTMSIAWIGAITYVVTWMITILGFTIGVPDSVMGLSFLAVGTSVPEVFSSIIVCRHGKGSMAVSNCIGSNTFDILICLGLPWLIKGLMSGTVEAEPGQALQWFVTVQSKGLTYTVISLLLSLLLLYAVLVFWRFVLSKTVAVVCLLTYLIFLTISLLFELNVLFVVNLPSCPSDW